ncbi:MAG: Trx7/PDZ domain-containing (seleno)protein [Limisphaerales bacterium]
MSFSTNFRSLERITTKAPKQDARTNRIRQRHQPNGFMPSRRPTSSLASATATTVAVLTILAGWAPGFAIHAETVADRKAAVLKDRQLLGEDPRWIYDDYERAFAEGRRTGKPVLVVLRCIPCLACIGIDSAVLLEHSSLSPLLDQFVCARVVNANALDLSRFEFDFDLSFSVLLFHGDGTLLGRYGSWTHQKNPIDNGTEGLRDTLEKALALHAAYPANKAALAGKQAHGSPYKTPVDMPTLKSKYTPKLDWEGEVVKSCVHCHQIGDALRAETRQRKERLPARLIFPFPAPETLGLELAGNAAATVRSVKPDSPAANAGLAPGDQIASLAGQPIVSAADVSWVLHHAPEAGTLDAVFLRGNETLTRPIPLAAGWRTHADISRRVGTWSMRAMALGGLLLEDLDDAQRTERGLGLGGMALLVKHVGEYNDHAAAKKAGFRKGDVLVSAADSSTRETESELIGRLLGRFDPGDAVAATVLRGDERIDLRWPIQ